MKKESIKFKCIKSNQIEQVLVARRNIDSGNFLEPFDNTITDIADEKCRECEHRNECLDKIIKI